MRSTAFLRLVGLALVASSVLSVGCGSSQTSAPAAAEVLGEYDTVGDVPEDGGIAEITFLDADHYEMMTTTGTEALDDTSGTYVLDLAGGTLTLTNGETGATKTLPFQPDSEGNVTPGDDSLHVLGGLTTPGQNLTGASQTLATPAVCGFTSGGQSFASSSTGCGGAAAAPKAGLLNVPDGGIALTQPCGPTQPFPTGVTFQQVQDPTTAAMYVSRLGAKPTGQGLVTCFVDMDNVVDGKTGMKSSGAVMVSAHYSLNQVAHGASTSPDRFVIVDPAAVVALEKFRASTGKDLAIYSAYRNPNHQLSTCKSVCRGASFCTACAKVSQHMYGDAYDLTDTSLLTAANEKLACNAGFRFAFNEGNHLHIDMYPRTSNGSCFTMSLGR